MNRFLSFSFLRQDRQRSRDNAQGCGIKDADRMSRICAAAGSCLVHQAIGEAQPQARVGRGASRRILRHAAP